ncbi:MAG TPA: hypothetical protein PK409_10075, partial [Thermosynergistes sp.]|nr:hypothetical protein [Thermosynergistes sp.]HQE22262.1 hypothetical protein [Thermosynergistes sp.]
MTLALYPPTALVYLRLKPRAISSLNCSAKADLKYTVSLSFKITLSYTFAFMFFGLTVAIYGLYI